jgi:hypothetical protein
MRPIETVPGINGGRGIKENDEDVNSTMIYCKNFGKCHNTPSIIIFFKGQKKKQFNSLTLLTSLLGRGLAGFHCLFTHVSFFVPWEPQSNCCRSYF